jgi:drug/metabolite transporter (DMT)-like permease
MAKGELRPIGIEPAILSARLASFKNKQIEEVSMGDGSDDRLKGTLYLLTGAVLISFAPVFVRLTTVGPMATGFYRVAIGGLILLGVAAVRREPLLPPRSVLWVTLAAGLAFAFDLGLWHHSIDLVGPGVATILANFQVFLLAAFGILVLREKFSWRYMAGTILAFGGVFLLLGRNWSDFTSGYRLGVLFGALTAVAYSVYLLLIRRLQREVPAERPLANLGGVTLSCALFLFVTVLITDETFAIPTLFDAGMLAALAITAQVVGWLAIAWGLPHVPASRAGLILLLQPTLAFVWDVIFFARPTGMIDGAGALLAVGGIYMGSRAR